MNTSGAKYIINTLIAFGIRRLYNFPGGTIAPILDAARETQIKIITARHEQGAGYAALAEARITGQVQVVAVSSGPGVTNIVTTIADAYFDSTPLLVLTGQVGTSDLKRDLPVRQRGFQEVDTMNLLKPVSKAQFLVEDSQELPAILHRALSLAIENRQGPVVVDLPINIQRNNCASTINTINRKVETVAINNLPLVEKIVDKLLKSARPLILCGQGVIAARAQKELRTLVECLNIPVTHSMLGLGAIPSQWPMNFGYHGHTGNQAAGKVIQEADYLLVLGSRLDLRQTGSVTEKFAPQATIVRVELDAAEIDHSRIDVDITIKADIKDILLEMLSIVKTKNIPHWSVWRDQTISYKETYPLIIETTEPLKPQFIINTLAEITKGKKTVCVTGVGSHQQWVARHFDFDFPNRILLTSGGHGAMGYDLPSAVGASFTSVDATVLCIVGDGSLQINIQELATLIEYDLPVKIIVLDNHRLGIVSQFQKLNWASDPGCGDKYNPDFAAIAKAYGLYSIRISKKIGIKQKLSQFIEHDGPALAHCIVDSIEDVKPMLLAGQTLDKMWNGE